MKFNKKNLIFLILIVLFLSNLIIFSSCKSKKTASPESKSGFFLGTYANIKLYDHYSSEVFNGCFSILKDIENKMSINIDTSEVSNINKKSGYEAVKVSSKTFYVIKKGDYYSSLSKGHFDISIGPLVKLWGIGSPNAKVPSNDEIKKSIDKINYKNILLDENNKTVKLASNDMIIDLGGIAKGYAADEIKNFLKSKGIDRALIDLGGNIYAMGSNPNNKNWSIGVQNPFQSRGEYIGILEVFDKSIVTSGIYERFLEIDGKKYHHILSPFTGYPVENSLVSTTIIADNSIDADGLSTTVFSLGLNEGIKLIESLKGIDAILVNNKKEVYITSGLKSTFSLTDTEFKLINH